jgi:hypothetical protein
MMLDCHFPFFCLREPLTQTPIPANVYTICHGPKFGVKLQHNVSCKKIMVKIAVGAFTNQKLKRLYERI